VLARLLASLLARLLRLSMWLEVSVVVTLRPACRMLTQRRAPFRQRCLTEDFEAVVCDLVARSITSHAKHDSLGGPNVGLLVSNMLRSYPRSCQSSLRTVHSSAEEITTTVGSPSIQ
jgi:hypothetical protein